MTTRSSTWSGCLPRAAVAGRGMQEQCLVSLPAPGTVAERSMAAQVLTPWQSLVQ